MMSLSTMQRNRNPTKSRHNEGTTRVSPVASVTSRFRGTEPGDTERSHSHRA